MHICIFIVSLEFEDVRLVELHTGLIKSMSYVLMNWWHREPRHWYWPISPCTEAVNRTVFAGLLLHRDRSDLRPICKTRDSYLIRKLVINKAHKSLLLQDWIADTPPNKESRCLKQLSVWRPYEGRWCKHWPLVNTIPDVTTLRCVFLHRFYNSRGPY